MDKKPEFFISACLCGRPVRYDGRDCGQPVYRRLVEEGRGIAACPECLGGLPTPRCPSEIRGGRVIARDGADVTAAFREGAQRALELCRRYGLRRAILKENSPSCGCRRIYDGSFTGAKIDGEGITARLLREHGIEVCSEEDGLPGELRLPADMPPRG